MRQIDTTNEAEVRRVYIDLQPGDSVEVVHFIKIGFREHASHTFGVVVKKERRRSGMDGGFARHWDDKYWFDHLTLRKDDGELTTVTIDEYSELRRPAGQQKGATRHPSEREMRP